MSEKQHSHITLIGEPTENFYQLGIQDKSAYNGLESQIETICSKSPAAAKLIKQATDLALNLSKKDYLLDAQIHAYAKGLGVSSETIFLNLFLPELVSSFNKWTPHLLALIPGCSSTFLWDEKSKQSVHTRILDYPLGNAFNEYERSITYKLDAEYKIYSHSIVGIPFPGLTSMNEQGLTLALHYKHSDYLNLNGQSIFSICYQILRYCSKVSEIKKFLRDYQSITSWGIYISDSYGEVCSVDIKGDEVSVERFDIKETKSLYFNNRSNSIKNKSLSPFGNLNQCMMRKESAQEKIKAIDHSKNIMHESLIHLTTVDEASSNHAINWKLNPLTCASVQAVSMDNYQMSCSWISTTSPKIFQGEVSQHDNIFSQIETQKHHYPIKNSERFIKAFNKISLFQTKLDEGNIEQAYHEIQMAITLYKGFPEFFIYTFYFTVLQYLYEKDKKDLSFIYKSLLGLKNRLPKYLEDHRLLFLLRLEIRLGLPITDSTDCFSNVELLKLFNREKGLGKIKIELLKNLIFPRVEVLDILYMY